MITLKHANKIEFATLTSTILAQKHCWIQIELKMMNTHKNRMRDNRYKSVPGKNKNIVMNWQ